MILGKRLIKTGVEAACTTDTADVFGDASGVALYTLDYDASDAGDNYDGTPTDIEFGVGGKINYGAMFNGSSSKITLPTGSPFNDSDTIKAVSIWVKADTSTSRVYAFSISSTSNTNDYFYIGYLGDLNRIYVAVRDGSSSNQNQRYANITPDTNWNHIVAQLNGSTVEIWMNGVQLTVVDGISGTATSSSWISYPSYSGTVQGAIGVLRLATPQYSNGDIDQLRVFSKALSSDEVSTLYAETACVYECTTDTVDFATTNLAYYKLDNSAEDETGTYDGAATNVNYAFGRFGQAAVFNGSSSYIDSNLQMPSTTTFSFSCWFNKDNSSANYHLIGDFNSSATLSSGRFRVRLDTSDQINVGVGNGTNMDFSLFTPSVSLNNVWRHIAVTIDGTSVKAYIDGSQVGTTDTSLYSLTSGVNNFAIGAYYPASGKQNFDGKIDQVRIFSSALTSDQVTQLYEEKPCEDTSNFKTVLYTGNGSTQYISNVGFEPDLVWTKSRNTTGSSHTVYDSVRGVSKFLQTNATNLENNGTTNTGGVTSFNSNGFDITLDSSFNLNNYLGRTYVAWCWKAGGDAVSNTDGSITSQVSANTEAGFSIVKFTTSGGSGTVGHGLSSTPDVVLMKRTSSTSDWYFFTTIIDGSMDLLRLNTSNTQISDSTQAFTSTTFKDWASTGDFIAYCFHSVAGYSKIGSYDGSSGTVSVSGLGFKPSFVIVKNYTDTANWNMYDLARGTVSDQMNNFLYPNLSNAETGGQSTYVLTANDDGFVVSAANHLQLNIAGSSYIYMAFK